MESSDAGYLIMRIKEQTAIMLSHDGAFVEVPLAQVPPDARHVGATTSLRRLPEEAPTPDPVRPASGRSAGPLTDWARWLAAAAAILVMLWGGSSAYEAWAYPYHIAVDINPSMILVFDRQAQLHEIRPRNAEAAEMLADIDMQAVRGTSPEEAVTALVSSAQIHGYLQAAVWDDMLADPALAFDGDASNLVVIGIHRQWRGDLPESLEPANLGQQVSAVAQEMKVNAAVVAQTVQGNEWRSAKRQNVSPNDLALGWAEQAPPPGPGLVKKLQELEESAAFTGVRRGVVIRSQLQPPGLQDGGPPGLRNDGPPGQQGDGAAGPPGPPGSVPGDHGEQDEDGNDDDSSETEEDNAAGDTAGEDSSAADLINGGPPLNVPPVNLPPLIP